MKLKLSFALSFLVVQLLSQDIEKLHSELSPSVATLLLKENKLVHAGLNDAHQIPAEGLGSGVYISEEGDTIKASHVVHNAESIMVIFPNGEKAAAKIKSSSEAADNAIIKKLHRPNTKIPVAKLGNSNFSRIGEKVMIIDGLLIQRVARISPAGKAGFKGGDILANADALEVILGSDIGIVINGITVHTDATLAEGGLSLNTTENDGTVSALPHRAGKEVKIKMLIP